ncbi:MAG: diacylglycerol kinase [Anaerolineae bacterium]|nr:diacylglycerol kinase [Anaerolineae bacterium]
MTDQAQPGPASPAEPIIFSTMQIDPRAYSARHAGSRFEATLYAIAGLLYLFRRQRSIQMMSVVTLICIGLALWLQVSLPLLVEMILAIGLVWVTEAVNTAIEAAVDVASPEYHPMAKVSKDVAAAATFIAICLAALVTFMIVVPPLLERLL